MQLDGQPLKLPSRRTEALVVYLLRNPQPQAREVLANLLWDDLPQNNALGNLRVLLANLRKALDPYVTITRQSAAWNMASDYRVDLTALEELLALSRVEIDRAGALTKATAASLGAALQHYQGDLLPGFYLHAGQGFAEWLASEREWLWTRVVEALDDLATEYLQWGDYRAGVEQAQRLVELDPLREEGHQLLMQLWAADGQISAALAQYKRCVQVLEQELGVSPHPFTTELYERMRAGDWRAPVTVTQIVVPSPLAIPHNLPRELTPFLGRATELATLCAYLLDPAYPLVTLVAEGGSGKTRLAQAAARRLQNHHPTPFPDGIWFVSLAALQADEGDRATAIASAVGSALGVLFQGRRSVTAQLLTLLEQRRALLLLDNIEQLIEPDGAAAAGVIDFVIALLEAAPHLHLLVTSRIALDLNSELVMRLPGLPVPAADLPEDAADYSSVQLFAERASRITEDIRLEQQLGEIAAICRLVAGLPLAIELAAAWSGALTPVEILLALQENLDFLASRRRDIPARQRSMRAVFDHSWQLLSPTAQAVLAQIACFSGGFTLAAARSILAVALHQPTSEENEDPIVAILDSLCHRALLHQDEGGRYTIHTLLRAYAAEQLTALTEVEQAATQALSQVTQRYRRYYLAFVGQATVRGWYTRAGLMPIQRDLANIRQAWQMTTACGDLAGLALGWRGLWHVYRGNALFQEGEDLFRTALVGVQAATPSAPDLLLLEAQLQIAHAAFLNAIGCYGEAVTVAQIGAGFAETVYDDLLKAEGYAVWGTGLYRQGQTLAAQKVLEQGLAAAQGAGAPLVEAQIHRRLGNTRQAAHDFAQAQKHYEAALALFRQHAHRPGEGEALTALGWCSQQQHDLAQALAYLQQAVQIHRAVDNPHGESMTLINLAVVYEQMGDYNQAYRCRQQVLKLLEQFDDPYQRVLVNHGLGVLLSRLGDYDAAESYLLRALAMDQELGDPAGAAWTQINLGLVYNRRGEVARGLAMHQTALQSSIALGARTTQGLAWSRLGQDYYALGEWEEAYEAYVQAIALQTELGQRIWAIEAQSGLAATQLALNLRAEALAQVEEILAYLAPEALDSAREPMLIYWNCYQVLAALSDPRAVDLLRSANQQLNAQAATLTDAAWQHSFLHNVDAHRLLRQEYARIEQSP